jgi:glyoxylase-like metal-dependent hydrolase (beta-lactamase superfamily II)
MDRETVQQEEAMLRERVAEEIYVFTSELYLQATASAIITSEGVIVIDTLPFPEETREMLRFIRRRGKGRIHAVILTHYHPDHSYGACFLPGELVAHERCRRILEKDGEQLLQADQALNPELSEVEIRTPETVFDRGTLSLHVGKKTVTLFHTPGHTSDGISAYVKEDKVLFAGDLVMPVPYIVGGDREAMRDSLREIGELQLDNIVQGHGDVLLRGEIPDTIETSLKYLDTIEREVRRRVSKGMPKSSLRRLDIERCHKSRIPLNGLVEELHQANLGYLYDVFSSQRELDHVAVARGDQAFDNSLRS